jgi:hypothetical protein
MITLTDRDNLTIKEWFEPFKYASIPQIEKAFFRGRQNSYEIARRRLSNMTENGFLKLYRDEIGNRSIYILKDDKIKPPSPHRMIVLDVLAEMKYCGFGVEYFSIEKQWLDRQIRSDAFTVFTIKKHRYHFFIEVHTSNNYHRLDKYNTLKDSGEVQKLLNKNLFPRILFISDYKYTDLHIDACEIIQLDTKLNMFPSILV